MAKVEILGWERFEFTDGPWTRDVYRRGTGPAVIVIHEIPGLHPLVIRYGERVAAEGFTVFMPSLFGVPNKPVTLGYGLATMAMTCMRAEFNVWANDKSSPIVDWLRALARKVHPECGGKGVGALGMCFTGGFALAMMTEPSVVAPVLSQPSMPFLGKGKVGKIDASPREIACAKQRFEGEDLSMIGLSFEGDELVPRERIKALKETFGTRYEDWSIADGEARQGTGRKPHSVLTVHLDSKGRTKEAADRTVAFFKERLIA